MQASRSRKTRLSTTSTTQRLCAWLDWSTSETLRCGGGGPLRLGKAVAAPQPETSHPCTAHVSHMRAAPDRSSARDAVERGHRCQGHGDGLLGRPSGGNLRQAARSPHSAAPCQTWSGASDRTSRLLERRATCRARRRPCCEAVTGEHKEWCTFPAKTPAPTSRGQHGATRQSHTHPALQVKKFHGRRPCQTSREWCGRYAAVLPGGALRRVRRRDVLATLERGC